MKYKNLFSSFTLLITSLFLMSGIAFADPALVTLTTSSNTYTPGSTVSVNIYINSNGSSLITGSIQVTYDSSKVSFVSVDESGSAFTGGGIPADTGSGNYVGVSKYQIGGISGSNLYFAKINFRANTVGQANFGLTSSTQISNGSGSNIYTSSGSSGKSISIQAPATPPTETPTTPASPPASNPTAPKQPTTNSTSNQTDQPQNASTTPSVASDGTVNEPVIAAEITTDSTVDEVDGLTEYASTIVDPSKKYALPVIIVISLIIFIILLIRFITKHIKNLKTAHEFKKNNQITGNSVQGSNPMMQDTGSIIHPQTSSDDGVRNDPNVKE